jgi:hypothetical protein
MVFISIDCIMIILLRGGPENGDFVVYFVLVIIPVICC